MGKAKELLRSANEESKKKSAAEIKQAEDALKEAIELRDYLAGQSKKLKTGVLRANCQDFAGTIDEIVSKLEYIVDYAKGLI